MRYNIAQDGEAVEIHVQDAGERAPQVLASIQECQQGRCGCPTDQYDRLASIEVGGGDGELTVTSHHAPVSTWTLMRCVTEWTTP